MPLTIMVRGISIFAGQGAADLPPWHLRRRPGKMVFSQVKVPQIYHRDKNSAADLPPSIRRFTTVNPQIYHRQSADLPPSIKLSTGIDLRLSSFGPRCYNNNPYDNMRAV
ncbi:hypothetical protein [Corynebacterium halotolerans]|uniref:hypothetical protein n=1 Tax=Corynebacterium halotolerans TaxID=225326 RepID=UPI0011EA61C5|nr:hypothetical protein [Corynebacterium halotolerans]